MKRLIWTFMLFIIIALTGCGRLTPSYDGTRFEISIKPSSDESVFILKGTLTGVEPDGTKYNITDGVIQIEGNASYTIPYEPSENCYYRELTTIAPGDT